MEGNKKVSVRRLVPIRNNPAALPGPITTMDITSLRIVLLFNGPNYTSLKSYQIILNENTFIYVALIIQNKG